MILVPVLVACPQPPPPKKAPDTPFLQTLDALKSPADPLRDSRLAQILTPVCGPDANERTKFVQDIKASVDAQLAKNQDAIAVVEHIGLRCKAKESGLDLFKKAKPVLGSPARIDLALARLAASSGDLALAMASAEAAKAAGSVGAVALLAQLESEEARKSNQGWVPGMLDKAIKTASVTGPQPTDPADLAAIVSVRAHLLVEKSIWEAPPAAEPARAEALGLFRRLAEPPFPNLMRERAVDFVCFNQTSAEEAAASYPACARAAAEWKILGAATTAKTPTDDNFDLTRLKSLQDLAAKLPKKNDVVLLVARGSEGDLLHWTIPLSRVLRKMPGTKVVVALGADSARANSLVSRALDLAKVKPAETFDLQANGPQATSCLAALLAGKPKPAACPFDEATSKRLAKVGKAKLAVLVGKSLDADLQDIKTAEIPTAMLSFRETSVASGPDTWLKSLSDTFVIAPRD